MKNISMFCILFFLYLHSSGQGNEMELIKGGNYTPLYGAVKNEKVLINQFLLDATPVTHGQFLEFVEKHPEWQKSNVIKLFADDSYLRLWSGDLEAPEDLLESPVIQVSWYAAKAFCECQGKRLPYVDEWEYAAMANEKLQDARTDSLFNQSIIRSYEKPKTYLNKVAQGPKNYWGIFDLHGLVWEWTMDFNSVIITGESRSNGNTDRSLFCASGAVGANDLMNYAAFMRYAIRSSLKANYTVTNLGFRCAKDIHIASSVQH